MRGETFDARACITQLALTIGIDPVAPSGEVCPDRVERFARLVAVDRSALRASPAQFVEFAKVRPELCRSALEKEVERVIDPASNHALAGDIGDRNLMKRSERVARREQSFGGESLLDRHGLEGDAVREVL